MSDEKEGTAPSTDTAAKEEPPKDDEGLLLEYDVIVCGTGLVQAILASALARAGKTVLHCDGDDSYGELDSVWTLDKLVQHEKEHDRTTGSATGETVTSNTKDDDDDDDDHAESNTISLSPKGGTRSLQFRSFQSRTKFGISVGSRVQTPYGSGVVTSLPTFDDSSSTGCHSMAVALDRWNLADGTAPVSYFGLDPSTMTTIDVLNDPLALEDMLRERHHIQSMASVQAQNLLHDARQSRLLALDASPVFVLAAGRAVNGMLASNVADYLEFKTVEGLVWLDNNNNNKGPSLSRVPCTKNDVFTTKLLSPMDKRRLMKFLQLAMDYATQLNVAEEFLREQRKEAAAASAANENEEEEVVQSLNERHLNQGRSLARPQNKMVATEDLVTLQQCMQQPDATLDGYLKTQHKLSPRLRSIIRYALSMETSQQAISLSQGMSQLRHHLQALGRYGTTAFLVPMYGSGELSQAFCRSAAVFGATYLLRRAPVGVTTTVAEDDENGGGSKKVQGIMIAPDTMDDIVADEARSSSNPKTIRCSHVVVSQDAMLAQARPSRRILRRISLLNGTLLEGEQRHVILLPPGSIGEHNYAIHGITMDESVQVAPAGCTVLHLTTTISNDDSDTTTILDQAAASILQASGNSSLVEVYHATFSYALPDVEQEDHTAGLHVCTPCGQVLTADVAFEQAERIFQQICPGQEFLGLSDELGAAIKERATERGYQDDERLMLESALGMIDRDEVSKATEDTAASQASDTSELRNEITAT